MSQHQYIPLDNKYSRIYRKLVESRKTIGRDFKPRCGYEKHHIIPKSLGGTDKKDNIVVLTPREHCVAHMLLARMYNGRAKAKMIFALQSMAAARNTHRNTISARLFDSLKKDYQSKLKDPAVREYRAELTRQQWTPERRAAVAEKTRIQWQDGIKRNSFSSKEYREKKSQQMKTRWQDPLYREWQTEITKKQWEDNPPH